MRAELLPDCSLSFPITKAEQQDDGSLVVEGYATSEAVDSADEVIDYPTSKALFAEWPGNIREQHDMRKAVGRALDWSADDAGKRIFLRARVSAGAPETIAKVMDGTLSCFSIMGPLKAKRAESVTARGLTRTITRLFLKRIAEVSLVDSGANPDSRFVVIKADNGRRSPAAPALPIPREKVAEIVRQEGGHMPEIRKRIGLAVATAQIGELLKGGARGARRK